MRILILALLFAGCTAEKQLAKISVKHPELLSKTCGNFFPVKENTIREIQYVQGQKDTIWQSEYIDCDTIIGKDRVLKVPYVIRLHDTLKTTEIQIKENTARVQALEIDLSQKEGQLISTKQTLKNTRGLLWIAISIITAIGLFTYLKTRLK